MIDRSGKSSYAQKLAEGFGKPVTFIATAQAFDKEMNARIKKHQSERPQNWQTLEIQTDIASRMKEITSEIVVLDCATLLVSNLMMKFVKEDIVDEEPFRKTIQNEIEKLLNAIRTSHHSDSPSRVHHDTHVPSDTVAQAPARPRL